jgi:inward rectifier potassium channel
MSARPDGVPEDAFGQKQQAGYTIWVRGADRTLLRDAYHTFLRLRWSVSIALIAAGYMLVNFVFAVVYFVVGGVDGLRTGSFFDAFVFSVQTLGTIGYGVMHPQSHTANIVMIVQSIVGIIVTALITGLIFSKFSRATGRIRFSTGAVICNHDGVPTLMFRIGNQRSNLIVDTMIHVALAKTMTTAEGKLFYKLHDLKLVRERIGGLRRGWTVMHVIDATSPLHGMDADAITAAECELEVSIVGLDDVTMQTVHAIHQFNDKQILYARQFTDTLVVLPNGDMFFDLTKFNDTEPDPSLRAEPDRAGTAGAGSAAGVARNEPGPPAEIDR